MQYRPAALALTAVAALSFAACAPAEGSTDSTPTVTETTAQEASPAALPAPAAASATTTTYVEPTPFLDEANLAEMAYLSTVDEYAYPSTSAALMVGRATCSLLDNGSTPQDLALELMVASEPVVPGFSNDDLPFFYGAAIGSMCPEHSWMLGLDLE